MISADIVKLGVSLGEGVSVKENVRVKVGSLVDVFVVVYVAVIDCVVVKELVTSSVSVSDSDKLMLSVLEFSVVRLFVRVLALVGDFVGVDVKSGDGESVTDVV